jgi:hypothetical protein
MRLEFLCDRTANVFARDTLIGIEQIVFGGAFCELPKNQFHFDPRSSDDRPAYHHVGIDFYTVCCYEMSASASFVIGVTAQPEYRSTVRRENAKFTGTSRPPRVWGMSKRSRTVMD